MTIEELLALAADANRKADAARGSQVENVSAESYQRGRAHAFQEVAFRMEMAARMTADA